MAQQILFQGHYSIKKGMAFLGLGLDNLVNVKADSKGKMDVQDLEEKILQLQSEVWYDTVDSLLNAQEATLADFKFSESFELYEL